MRPLILISALVWAGCGVDSAPQPPPTDRFVYPSGIVHRQVAGSPNGALYVASANFDKCFDSGAVLALDLDNLGLPGLGAAVGPEGPVEITDLQVRPEATVQIESFAGEMALWAPAEGTPRLFVPTRAEENFLHAIDIQDKTTLTCGQGQEQGRNCTLGALSLTRDVQGAVNDQPRAPAPIGVTVEDVQGQPLVWVTHIEAADSPARSAKSFQTYVVRIPNAGGAELSLSTENFIPLSSWGLSIGGAQATAIGAQYTYVAGRSYVAGLQTQPASFLLRLIDKDDPSRILETDLGAIYRTLEARDVVLGRRDEAQDRERLYIVARAPDTLIVVDVLDASGSRPRIAVVDAVLLPDGASDARVLSRGGPGDEVVAVTSTASVRINGVVVLYDAKLGEIVAQVGDVGRQPYGLAVDQRTTGTGTQQARIYVTNFGDGRVAVIDIPNLTRPQEARLVAYLGKAQGRDEKQGTSTCQQQEIEP
jgi:hypothetical protein